MTGCRSTARTMPIVGLQIEQLHHLDAISSELSNGAEHSNHVVQTDRRIRVLPPADQLSLADARLFFELRGRNPVLLQESLQKRLRPHRLRASQISLHMFSFESKVLYLCLSRTEEDHVSTRPLQFLGLMVRAARTKRG